MTPTPVPVDDWDGHVLLLHRSESQRRACVSQWVRRGLQLGSKIFYIQASTAPPHRSVLALLQDQADAWAAVERGQVEVVHADETACDPTWQATSVHNALEQGYPSVRWSGEASTAWSVMPRAQHAAVEHAVDQLCRTQPVSVLCQYAANDADEDLPRLCQSHSAGLRDQRLTAVPVDGGIGVAGDVDRANQAALHAVLDAAAAAAAGGSLVVQLKHLRFLDVAGARALLGGTAAYREAGGRVHVHAAAPQVERLLRLVGVDRAPGVCLERGV